MQNSQGQTADEQGRRSRFGFDNPMSIGNIRDASLPASLRERAASQPPRRPGEAPLSRLDLSQRRYESPFGAPGTPPPSTTASFPHWSASRHASFAANSSIATGSMTGMFHSRIAPTRSLSFSTTNDLPTRMQSYVGEGFPSTFEEDDEEELDALNVTRYDHAAGGHPMAMSFSANDAAYLRNARASALAAAEGSSRSRSQSLAAVNRRQLPNHLNVSGTLPAPGSAGVAQSWTDALGGMRGYPRNQPHSAGINIPATKAPPYSVVGGSHSLSSNGMLYRNASGSEGPDLSNMSPFVRDVGQILGDDNAAFRDLWGNAPGLNHHFGIREDGGGSGTTSRRHSVSVVQPRSRQASSAVMGFSGGTTLDPAIEDEDGQDDFGASSVGRGWGAATNGASFAHRQFGGTGRNVITDDELAIDLNNLNLQLENQSRSTAAPYRHGDVSQPSSLPNFGNLQTPSLPLASGERPHGILPPHERETPRFDQQAGRQASVSPSRFSRRRISVDPNDSQLPSPGIGPDFSQPLSPPVGQHRTSAIQGMAYGGQASASQQHRATRGPGPLSLMNLGAAPPRGPVSPSIAQPGLSPTLRQQRPLAVGGGAMGSMGPPAMFGGPTGGGRGSIGGSQQQANYSPMSPTVPSFGGPRASLSHSDGFGAYGAGGQAVPLMNAQPQLSPTSNTPGMNNLADLGRGVPLHSISSSTPLFVVEFKGNRADLYFCVDPALVPEINIGDVVIVEADRGRDLGTVKQAGISGDEVEIFQRMQAQRQSMMMGEDPEVASAKPMKEIMPKRLYGKANAGDIELMVAKAQDEAKALQLCQTKVRAKKLPMEVVDAEYQWDRRKLTFYFVSDRRIDFRELVRELFRLYKTRIWMACLQGPTGSATDS